MKPRLKWNVLLLLLDDCLGMRSKPEPNTDRSDRRCVISSKDKIFVNAENVVKPVQPTQQEKTGDNHDEQSSTKHKKNRKPNRLAKESSPYLYCCMLTILSIGILGEPKRLPKRKKKGSRFFSPLDTAVAYWCHVMERKVFENEEIAKYMNEHFVNIKVDREERPDIDDIYMTSLHIYSARW